MTKDAKSVELLPKREVHILAVHEPLNEIQYARLKQQCSENFGAGNFILLEGGLKHEGTTHIIDTRTPQPTDTCAVGVEDVERIKLLEEMLERACDFIASKTPFTTPAEKRFRAALRQPKSGE